MRDVAAIWRALDESAGSSWTAQRVLLEAARALAARRNYWPYPGAVLVVAGSNVTGAEAGFFRAIPGAILGLLAARPAREHYLDRLAALFGGEAASALRSTSAPRANGSECNLLASYLFEPPAILADPERPRSHRGVTARRI